MLNNLSRRTLCIIAGSIWLLAGANLLFLGARFLIDSAATPSHAGSNLPLLHAVMEWMPQESFAVPFLACIGVMIGCLKGRMVLRRAACREVERIFALPQPVSIFELYSVRGAIVLGVMFCLGFLLKFLNLPLDIRGVIDVAIGIALILGSAHYLSVEEGPVRA